MYFPLLRGKQNELLALRELLEENSLSKEILPIIEPIKPSATFRLLLNHFQDKTRELMVIQNTNLTNYVGFDNDEVSEIKAEDNFIPTYYIKKDEDLNLMNKEKAYNALILGKKAKVDVGKILDSKLYLIVNTQNRTIRDLLRANVEKLVELNDSFDKQKRNQDYEQENDEVFSEEHLYYKKDGFLGFSDYSIVGEEFIDAGFAPKAVAIHIVYFDKDNKLRIRHFVSDSNDDIFNPAGKFAEALKKLIDWYAGNSFDRKNDSNALREFKKLNDAGTYPGLGVIKKLSIKHHLEIMGKFLEGQKNELLQ